MLREWHRPGGRKYLQKIHLIKNCYPNYTKNFRDFPGGPLVKNPPSNAGHTGLISGWGTKIPRAAGQLSLRATTIELVRLN